MKADEGPEKEKEPNINKNKNFLYNLPSLNSEQIKNIGKISNNIAHPRKQSSDSNQENIKKSFFKEFGIKEKKVIKTFDYNQLMSKKSCSSYHFGDEHIFQKAFYCSICDPKRKYYICKYCHDFCHKKCRNTLKEIPNSLAKQESLDFQKFTCHCGSHLKHTFDVKDRKDLVSCNMMELDNILGIPPYRCTHHNLIVCCICSVVCHKECNPQIEYNNSYEDLFCQCESDFHSHFNELALSFPLEKYKKVSNIDVWPVQILNILFHKGKTFNKMSLFFGRLLSINIDFNLQKNNAIINQFKSLLELFSDTFNRKFKTYYYDEQMIQTFDYGKLFSLIKNIEVTNEQTTIIKFRLLFILLFIHLRKDFRTIKSFTTNDFMCNSVLQRLLYKKLIKSKTILTEKIKNKRRFSIKKICLG